MKTLTIKISGMTCSGCKQTVTQALQGVKSVIRANVSLENDTATIEIKNNIRIEDLQKSLPGKYQIEKENPIQPVHNSKDKSYLLDLYPLFLILFYITISSAIMNWNKTLDNFMMDFMGLFYIVFSFFKFLDYKNFPKSFSMYDPLAKNISIYGWIYPFIETFLGLMFLFRIEIFLSLVLTIVLLFITTIGVIKVLTNKEEIQCACLGTAIKLPMTIATLIENSIMIIMAIITIIRLNV
ncbi:MAG: heavy metal transporter [Candidatus Marinimicrobia bacterium]|nr:heavy metal transporter [Candidatus Neomarinimicrobiota bacterium]|tara:strand:- start:262 stop:978 length:717 start_codon:yes stop_codon:yes gene_type:complete